MLYDGNDVYDGKEVGLGLALCVAAEFALLALQTLSKLIEHILQMMMMIVVTCK